MVPGPCVLGCVAPAPQSTPPSSHTHASVLPVLPVHLENQLRHYCHCVWHSQRGGLAKPAVQYPEEMRQASNEKPPAAARGGPSTATGPDWGSEPAAARVVRARAHLGGPFWCRRGGGGITPRQNPGPRMQPLTQHRHPACGAPARRHGGAKAAAAAARGAGGAKCAGWPGRAGVLGRFPIRQAGPAGAGATALGARAAPGRW
jgi:hypothetical protein